MYRRQLPSTPILLKNATGSRTGPYQADAMAEAGGIVVVCQTPALGNAFRYLLKVADPGPRPHCLHYAIAHLQGGLEHLLLLPVRLAQYPGPCHVAHVPPVRGTA